MFRVLIVTDGSEQVKRLSARLSEMGLACSIASGKDEAIEKLSGPGLDLALVATNGSPAGLRHLLQRVERERHLPIIALLSRESLHSLDATPAVDDFVVEPWDAAEVALRLKRAVQKRHNLDDGDLIRRGDLVIDQAKCEVYVKGKPVLLTFKEYELLKFLALNKGRVFTREALLNGVWGYDYYGGDRTVDVHIRRIRSKIEDTERPYIETVRNMGYRFTDEADSP